MNATAETQMAAARRTFIWLFLTLYFAFLVTSSGRVRSTDEVVLALEVESMAAHGTTAIPQALEQKLFYGKYDRFGRPQGPYGPGNVVLVLPWYWLGASASAIAPGVPAGVKSLFADLFTVGSSAAFSALAAALSFLIYARLGIERRTAFVAAMMLALGTPIFCYSSWFYSEPLAAALLLGATYFLFCASGPEQAVNAKHAALAGVLLGLLLWVRATHVIVIPVFLAALILRNAKANWRSAVTLGTLAGVFGAAYLLRNHYLFGNPLDFGYPEFGEGGKNMLGFDTPLLAGLSIFLFSPGKSMLLFAPAVLLAIPGIFLLAKRDRGLGTIAAGIPIVFLFFFSRYSHVEGGYSFGPRYLVPAIALASLGLGPMLAEGKRWVWRAALVLFLAGFLIQGVGMATNFIEDMATGAYYDANWAYRTDYSPIPRMSKQLYFYATSTSPAPLGRGYDRWFVFLSKAGVKHGTIAAILICEIAGFAFCVWRLRRSLLAAGEGAREIGEPSRAKPVSNA
jgi:hypothetical protein